MRFLLLSVFIAFASSSGSASAAMASDETSISKLNAGIEAWSRSLAASNQIQRSLRGYVDQVDGNEERWIEKAAEKLDDALAAALHSPRLPAGLSGTVLAKIDDVMPKVEAALKKYPEGLSAGAMKQLRQIEEQRIKDAHLIAKANKHTPDGLHREIEPFPGMKVAPTIESHVGRSEQVYTKEGARMVVCGVVMRPESQGGGILLISSSKLDKQQFGLPKGGLEHRETPEMGMRRELVEEGGVSGVFKADLGDTTVDDKIFRSYLMHADETFDQWPESMRYRAWFEWDDAILALKEKNPGMARIVEKARDAAAKLP